MFDAREPGRRARRVLPRLSPLPPDPSRSSELPSDTVLEGLFVELEAAAAGPELADAAELAARHGVPQELVENCLASLQLFTPEVHLAHLAPLSQAGPGSAGLDRLGPYELLGVLGRGGMGAVYRARHPHLEREVALKVLRSGANATPHQRARFLREAEALAALCHPHVVTIHAAGQATAGGYLVMELIEDARSITAAGADLDWRGRVALARDAARGLGYAHARGVIHRDLKPENLLVDPTGRVRISDFGLARLAQGERLTQTGALVGTLGYMPPEQAQGEVARQGPPSDVWSLGAVLYELLAGAPLFAAASFDSERYAQVAAALPALRSAHADLPRDLEAVCRRALALDPADRYPDGDALADDLDAVLAERRPAGVVQRPWASALLVAALLLAAGLTLAVGSALGAGSRSAASATPSPSSIASTPERLQGSAAPADPSDSPPTPSRAPWEAEAQGPTRADALLSAWRWLRAHPAHPRAGLARALLRDGRRRPVCALEHSAAGRPARVEFDGDRALLSASEGELRRWAIPSGDSLASWQVEALVEARRLPDGDWVLAGHGALERWPGSLLQGDALPARGPAGRLGAKDRVQRGATWVAPFRGSPSGPCELSPDGRWVATCAGAGGVVVASAADGALRTLRDRRGGAPRRLVFTGPDRLLVARERPESGYTLELWDLAATRLLSSQPGLAVSALAWLPERGLLLLGSHRGTITIHDAATLEVQGTLADPALSKDGGALVFSGDEAVGQLAPLPGRSAVLALPGWEVPAADRALKWLDLARGGGGPVTPPLTAVANALALSPDGALAAVGSRDGRVEVWLLPGESP